jgi:hypothetical protein
MKRGGKEQLANSDSYLLVFHQTLTILQEYECPVLSVEIEKQIDVIDDYTLATVVAATTSSSLQCALNGVVQ